LHSIFNLFNQKRRNAPLLIKELLQIKVPKASTSLSHWSRWLSEVEAFGTELIRFSHHVPNRYTISEIADQVLRFFLGYILHKEFGDYSSH